METETIPFGKELRMAMPQETLDGHRASMGRTSEEGPTIKGFNRAIGRQRN